MDQDIQQKLDELEKKIDAIYKSVEKTRRYFKIITWITIILIVLPLIGSVFVIPMFMHNYVDTLSGLGMMQ